MSLVRGRSRFKICEAEIIPSMVIDLLLKVGQAFQPGLLGELGRSFELKTVHGRLGSLPHVGPCPASIPVLTSILAGV